MSNTIKHGLIKKRRTLDVDKKADIFVVLGHEIQFPSFELSIPSQKRCEVLFEAITSLHKLDAPIIFMGKGRLQGDCHMNISECMYDYFRRRFFSLDNCFLDNNSIDTVGDAVYSRNFAEVTKDARYVSVVTSDWHAKRARLIFDAVYSKSNYEINIIASNEHREMSSQRKAIIQGSEDQSATAFLKTFPDFADIVNWEEEMHKRHPLYK